MQNLNISIKGGLQMLPIRVIKYKGKKKSFEFILTLYEVTQRGLDFNNVLKFF